MLFYGTTAHRSSTSPVICESQMFSGPQNFWWRQMFQKWLTIEIALATDGLRTRRLNSLTFADLPILTSVTQTNDGAAAWYIDKELALILHGRVESEFPTPIGWVMIWERNVFRMLWFHVNRWQLLRPEDLRSGKHLGFADYERGGTSSTVVP